VIDKSKREDGTLSREDFRFDTERNVYICPALDGYVLFTHFLIANGGYGIIAKNGRPQLDDPQVKEAVIKALTYITGPVVVGWSPSA
jgi:hypothetical protein